MRNGTLPPTHLQRGFKSHTVETEPPDAKSRSSLYLEIFRHTSICSAWDVMACCPSKCEAIKRAREWLKSLVTDEHSSKKRCHITPAWFWLAVFEMFYYTGIRLNALLSLRHQDIDWAKGLIRVQADTEKTHREFSIPICPGLAPYLPTASA